MPHLVPHCTGPGVARSVLACTVTMHANSHTVPPPTRPALAPVCKTRASASAAGLPERLIPGLAAHTLEPGSSGRLHTGHFMWFVCPDGAPLAARATRLRLCTLEFACCIRGTGFLRFGTRFIYMGAPDASGVSYHAQSEARVRSAWFSPREMTQLSLIGTGFARVNGARV